MDYMDQVREAYRTIAGKTPSQMTTLQLELQVEALMEQSFEMRANGIPATRVNAELRALRAEQKRRGGRR